MGIPGRNRPSEQSRVVMKEPSLFASCLVFLVVAVAQATPNSVISLSDADFEHQTQAVTGSTTGDWFIKFCLPGSDDCKLLAPVYAELGEKIAALKAEEGAYVNIAEVDLSTSP